MLHQLGYLKLALVLETRPYNQGSRLTSYELKVHIFKDIRMCEIFIF